MINPILVLYNHKIEQKLHTANKQIQFETKTKQSVFVLVLIVLSISWKWKVRWYLSFTMR